jgi:hypothetical protein
LMHAAPTSARELKHIGSGQTGTDVEQDGALVPSGTGFAAVWRRQRAGVDYLVFARLQADATLDGAERADPLFGTRPGLAVGSSGAGLAAAYATEGAVAVRLLGSDGNWLGGPLLLPGSKEGGNPSIVWRPPEYVVAWSGPATADAPDGSADGASLTSARVDPASREVRLLSGLVTRGAAPRAALAAVGDSIVMAWSDRERDAGSSLVLTAAFDRNGVRLAATQKQAGQASDTAPALASNGSSAGLVWAEPAGAGRTKLVWARIKATGERQGDPLAVLGSEVTASAPVPAALAWDAAGFVLARVGAKPNEVAIHRFGPLGCDARP